jgi:hypothetical protein
VRYVGSVKVAPGSMRLKLASLKTPSLLILTAPAHDLQLSLPTLTFSINFHDFYDSIYFFLRV